MSSAADRLRVAVFFGGPAREREVSFVGGRTVYDNLNRTLFDPIPIFVDSTSRFIRLNWAHVYKGTIRDFFPPTSQSVIVSQHYASSVYIESFRALTDHDWYKMANQVGVPVHPHQFAALFDLAFLALHGPAGEDGAIQGLLQWYSIPYTGAGIFPSALAIDKSIQQHLMKTANIPTAESKTITWDSWRTADRNTLFHDVSHMLGTNLVVKPARQGSSIGVTVIHDATVHSLSTALNHAFFVLEMPVQEWQQLSKEAKNRFIADMIDLRTGIGLPVTAAVEGSTDYAPLHHPVDLAKWLDSQPSSSTVVLRSVMAETVVLIEKFIEGKEFSCIVIDGGHSPIALPPTEIRKKQALYDYRAKYLPGITRKVTPIDEPDETIRRIQQACISLYKSLNFEVYARMDGFLSHHGDLVLNDPNTTSGMQPSSFFFHQAAEIGLNPSQFLTFIIHASLQARMVSGGDISSLDRLGYRLNAAMAGMQQNRSIRKRVAVLMGGYSAERHISVESGRNVYEKLASSDKYDPFPVFLTRHAGKMKLFHIPLNLMLKDNADDIHEKVLKPVSRHAVVSEIVEAAADLTERYAGSALVMPEEVTFESLAQRADVVFIALHGRPGEDGVVQTELERVGLPYNGSRADSAALTIDKYATITRLREAGFVVTPQRKVRKDEWKRDADGAVDSVLGEFRLPFIAKPVDDGCSAAVMRMDSREKVVAYMRQIFREDGEGVDKKDTDTLGVGSNEEFAVKQEVLVEEMIQGNGCDHFLEITGGMMTRMGEDGNIEFETFEPSEVRATSGVLSLEEKFLAGEGQNLTPARLSKDEAKQERLSRQVREELERAARTVGVEGYCRIDAFVRIFGDRAETVVIEVNSLPGMTPATVIFHQAALQGVKPYELIDGLLEFGVARQRMVDDAT